jgi:hypothetical protein
MRDNLGGIMESVFLSNISPENFTRVSHEFLLHSIYNKLSATRDDLDATEKLIAQLGMELLIERMALEGAAGSTELLVHAKYKALPEYWRMAARKKLEEMKK